ncbi:hypothetical protein ABT096_37365 [Streptomyces sp. NPDC002561]|uniref:hypothetical protein n=1 Tax=unclassified Streptomyces TaxID=2593676 RepID=UPI0011E6BDA8|nr:hypothetical protein [Streptomyces sp. sk2.1]TXS64231.1 hypothetical protein EAO76_39570 [Streptomyces sp. sk2.1]
MPDRPAAEGSDVVVDQLLADYGTPAFEAVRRAVRQALDHHRADRRPARQDRRPAARAAGGRQTRGWRLTPAAVREVAEATAEAGVDVVPADAEIWVLPG